MAYVSRQSPDLSEDDLVSLSLEAQNRNIALRVTGALFLTGGRFLQILEGDHTAVSWLFDRIARDRRHHRVVPVLDCAIDTRVFDGFSMRIMEEHDLALEWRRIVVDTLDRAERLDEVGGRLKAVEFAHCYAALGNSTPRSHARPL